MCFCCCLLVEHPGGREHFFIRKTLFGRVGAGFKIAGADIRDAADQIGESHFFDICIRIRKSGKNDWEYRGREDHRPLSVLLPGQSGRVSGFGAESGGDQVGYLESVHENPEQHDSRGYEEYLGCGMSGDEGGRCEWHKADDRDDERGRRR